jgi:hypothetical protein
MTDIFVKQLDGCGYLVDGVPSGGFNCTCAVEAMWLFRASGGRINVTACECRRRTGDRSGGTHLGQMEDVSESFGITGGKVYRPIATTTALGLIATRRYGTHWQGSYSVLADTPYDCFRGRFRGNHDWYISGPGTRAGTLRVADPGADGRYDGCPRGYQDIPISLMSLAAARLDVGSRMLGTGLLYAYFTPPDPAVLNHYRATTVRATALWNDGTKRWVYSTDKVASGQPLEVRGKQFEKGGVMTYPVTTGPCSDGRVRQVDGDIINIAGYYIPVANTKLGGRCG